MIETVSPPSSLVSKNKSQSSDGMVSDPEFTLPAVSYPLRVTDLKQWFYCPRICYWTYVVPVEKRLPLKVAYGQADHALLAHLEERRSLKAYGLSEGRRHFHVRVHSSRLGLTGILDALLETEQERIPVEYKDTLGGVRLNHRIQLAAYAMMLKEEPGPPVRRGMVFVIPENRAYSVRLDTALEAKVGEALSALRKTLESETLPPPTDRWAKCRDCEFLRFCGDRYEIVDSQGR
jgi:CRISPR-associated exonuclease Cas4